MSCNIYTQVSKGELWYNLGISSVIHLRWNIAPRNILFYWELSKPRYQGYTFPSSRRLDKWNPEIRRLAKMGQTWYNYIFPPSLNSATRYAQRKVILISEKKQLLEKDQVKRVSPEQTTLLPSWKPLWIQVRGNCWEFLKCAHRNKDVRKTWEKMDRDSGKEWGKKDWVLIWNFKILVIIW